MEIVLFDRELEVMEVLWERELATVAEVRDALEDELAYTTVLTVLRRLEAKGYVARRGEGRAHRYLTTLDRGKVLDSALERLISRHFNGSSDLLMTHLFSQLRSPHVVPSLL